MRIAQKRIRNAENFLTGISKGGNFYLGLSGLNDFTAQLVRIGFAPNITIGQQLLPAIIGPVSRFNANGGNTIRRDKPMETVYREAVVTDWHGYPHTVHIPYKMYPRDPIPPPSIELRIVNGADNNPLLVSPILSNRDNKKNMELVKHIINLYLEIFGECETLLDNLLPTFNVPVTRLNWNVLPKGNYPWQVLAPTIQGIINLVNASKRTLIQSRIQKISSYSPNFVAVGTAGFKGYVVFGFASKNFFLLESIYTGNATYVLGNNWAQISQYTKEQILTQNLQQQRLVHTTGWDVQIDTLLS